MDELRQTLRQEAEAWQARGLARQLALPHGVDFCSNDYLGLRHEPRVVAAAHEALERDGVGAPSSRLLRGHLAVHEEAEREAAHWSGEEAALLFPSGYQANLALLSTMAGPEDIVLSDALNHASLIDGMRLARARRRILPHLDLDAYEDALATSAAARRRLLVVEDVYSMDGDLAPIAPLLQLCEQYDAYLIVDSAHAAGLLSMRGSGHPRLLARILTGGKALGAAGAFVCGSAELREQLINHGRSFIFTTATPPATAAALTAAMRLIQQEPERGRMVLEKAEYLRESCRRHGLQVGGAAGIVPLFLGAAERAMAMAAEVQARGFDVRAVRPPTVPEGSSRLRLVVHADHSHEQLDALSEALAAADAAHAKRHFLDLAPPLAPAPMVVVAGTDTDVGKTVISALLLRASQRLGLPCRYLKPIQTGEELDTPTVAKLAELPDEALMEPLCQLPLPASPDQAAAAVGQELVLKELLEGITRQRRLAAKAKALVVAECAGGLRVPLNARADQLDLLQRLRAPLVLVARSGLGTLNHTLLSLEACAARGLPVRALFLVGESHPANLASLRARTGSLPIHEVPRFKRLDPSSLDLWLDTEDLASLLTNLEPQT